MLGAHCDYHFGTDRQFAGYVDRPDGGVEPKVAANGGDDMPWDAGDLAHEAGGEKARRPCIDPLRRPDVLDPPVVHDDQDIGQRHRLLLVVGDVHESSADAALQQLQFILHLSSQLEVERAQRFVEQQHQRFDHQRAGKGNALALAAGQLVRLPIEDAGQADQCATPRRPGGRGHRATLPAS